MLINKYKFAPVHINIYNLKNYIIPSLIMEFNETFSSFKEKGNI